jgi:hypothetical protein
LLTHPEALMLQVGIVFLQNKQLLRLRRSLIKGFFLDAENGSRPLGVDARPYQRWISS